jgi:hypothetical protein
MPIRIPPPETLRAIFARTLVYIDADRRVNELQASRPDAREEIAEAIRERGRALTHLVRRYDEGAGAAAYGGSEADARALRTIGRLCGKTVDTPRLADFPGLKDELEGLMAAGARDRSAAETIWISASEAQQWAADAGIKISLQTMQTWKDREKFGSREGGSNCSYEVERASFAAWVLDWWGEQLARKKRRKL